MDVRVNSVALIEQRQSQIAGSCLRVLGDAQQITESWLLNVQLYFPQLQIPSELHYSLPQWLSRVVSGDGAMISYPRSATTAWKADPLTVWACLQCTPLVGVPSFVEVSQQRDLHCFFVMVRSTAALSDREDPADSAFDEALAPAFLDETSPAGSCEAEAEGVILPRPMWPIMAFAAAIEDEPCELLCFSFG